MALGETVSFDENSDITDPASGVMALRRARESFHHNSRKDKGAVGSSLCSWPPRGMRLTLDPDMASRNEQVSMETPFFLMSLVNVVLVQEPQVAGMVCRSE